MGEHHARGQQTYYNQGGVGSSPKFQLKFCYEFGLTEISFHL